MRFLKRLFKSKNAHENHHQPTDERGKNNSQVKTSWGKRMNSVHNKLTEGAYYISRMIRSRGGWSRRQDEKKQHKS